MSATLVGAAVITMGVGAGVGTAVGASDPTGTTRTGAFVNVVGAVVGASCSGWGAHVGTASSIPSTATPRSTVSHQQLEGAPGAGPAASQSRSAAGARKEEQNWSLTVRGAAGSASAPAWSTQGTLKWPPKSILAATRPAVTLMSWQESPLRSAMAPSGVAVSWAAVTKSTL